MAKKSKWQQAEFPFGGFHPRYTPRFVTDVLFTVEEAAYKAMLQKNYEVLKEAVLGIRFPTQESEHTSFSGTLTWTYHIEKGLAYLAEMLWYRHVPTDNCIKDYANKNKLPLDGIVEELCKQRAQRLRVDFTHAWRLLDSQISEKIGEALGGLIEEVLAQTFYQVPGNDLPLDQAQLYKLAVSTEELLRKKRMTFGRGGRDSPYLLRMWFPQYYATAYRALTKGAEIYKKTQQSNNKKEREGWREAIKAEYPDLHDELIARLSGKESDLTDEHKVLLAKQGGDSTPHEIALEQAARWCGIRRYLYTKRGLLKRLEVAGKHKANFYSSGMHTLLFNWYRTGRKLTEAQIEEIFFIMKSLPPSLKREPID